MSNSTGLKSFFATVKGVETSLHTLLSTSAHTEEEKKINSALQLIGEVKKDLQTHIYTANKSRETPRN